MSSLDRILPFLKPIEDLLRDGRITEVMVNDGGRHVFVERDGALEPVADRQLETRNRVTLCRCGQSANKPLCDGSHKTAGFEDH